MKRKWNRVRKSLAALLAAVICMECGLLPVGGEIAYAAQRSETATASDSAGSHTDEDAPDHEDGEWTMPVPASASDSLYVSATSSDADLEEWEIDGRIEDDRLISGRALTPDQLPATFAVATLMSEESETIVEADAKKEQIVDETKPVTFVYRSVSGEQLEYSFDPQEEHYTYVLLTPFTEEVKTEGGGTEVFAGFRIDSVCINLDVQVEDEIINCNFYVEPDSLENLEFVIRMTLMKQTIAAEDMFYRDVEDEWQQLSEADYQASRERTLFTFTTGKSAGCYGGYLSEHKDTDGVALLYYAEGSNLEGTPREDAEAMKRMLLGTDQYSSDDIYLLPIDSDSDTAGDDMLAQIEEKLENVTDESMSLIYYSGHGMYLSDGSAALATGSSVADYVTGEALRECLSQYPGTFLLIFDACYSGGMLRSASTQERAAEYASDLAESFEAESRQTRNAYETRFKVFAAASNQEVSWQLRNAGSQLTIAIGHGLGFDRDVNEYHTFAADVEAEDETPGGDGQVTMSELTRYVAKQGMCSTPTFSQTEDTTVLFTYGEDGNSAYFDVNVDSGCLRVPGEPTEHDTVKADILIPISQLSEDKLHWNIQPVQLNDFENVLSLETETGTYDSSDIHEGMIKAPVEIPIDELDSGWVLCVGSVDANGSRQFIPFTITLEESSVEDMKEYLAFKEPDMIYSSSQEVIPVTVQFDKEPTIKSQAAACTLSLCVYALDENDNEEEIADLYKNYRPSYLADNRNDEEEGQGIRTSSYTYRWDVSGLDKETEYLLKLTASYDDESVHEVTATLKFTDEAELPEMIEEWYAEVNIPLVVGDDLETCEEFLEDTAREYTRTVSGWFVYDKELGEYTLVEDPSSVHAEPDNKYVSRITVSIQDGVDKVFSESCLVYANSYDVETIPAVSEDGKQLIYDVYYNIPDIDAEALKSYVTVGGAIEKGVSVTINIHQQPEMYGISLYNVSSTTNGEKIKVSKQEDGTYLIPENSETLNVLLWLKSKASADEVQSYAIYRLEYPVKNSGLIRCEEPEVVWYDAGESEILDLTGGAIVCDGQSVPLTGEMLVGWEDDNLKQMGVYPVMVSYDGKTVEHAFTVYVGMTCSVENGRLSTDDLKLSYTQDKRLDAADPGTDYEHVTLQLCPVMQTQTEEKIRQQFAMQFQVASQDEDGNEEIRNAYYYGGSFTVRIPRAAETMNGDLWEVRVPESGICGTVIESGENEVSVFRKQDTDMTLIYSRISTPEPEPEPTPTPTPTQEGESSDNGSSDDEYAGGSSGKADEGSATGQWNMQTAGDRVLWQCLIPGTGYMTDIWCRLWWNGSLDWYRFDQNGYMVTGWQMDPDGRRYYLNPVSDGTQGRMLTGWQQIAGRWYYFYPQPGAPMGSLAVNTWIDGHYVDENGMMQN